MKNVQLRILDPRIREYLESPYGTEGSAAIDLRACIEEPLKLGPQESMLVPTGIAIHIADPGYAALIVPRSGLGAKHGIVLGNGTGLIDSDYQGQIMVSLLNRKTLSNDAVGILSSLSLPSPSFIINPMDRIAQMFLVPVERMEFTIVQQFTKSQRGEGGFGSTGVA